MATLEEQLNGLITAVGSDVKELEGRRVIIWETGDADPTPIPAGHRYIFNLATADPLPAWAPTGSIVIRS
jgi:hypothetical protein